MRGPRISIKTLAIAMLAGHVLLASALLAMFWWSGLRHAQETAAGYQQRVTEMVSAHLDAFFQQPIDAIEQAAQGIRLDVVSPRNPRRLRRFFVAQVRALEGLTNLSWGGVDGGYVNAYRDWSDPEEVHVAESSGDGTMLSFRVDELGAPVEQLFTQPGFRVAARPWYRTGASSLESAPVWFPAYVFHSGEAIAIGVSRPLFARDGSLLGVLASDTSLEEISRMLHDIEISTGGALFVLDEKNRLLADSTGKPPIEAEDDTLRRLMIAESSRPAIRAAAQVVNGPLDGASIQRTTRFDDTDYLVFLRDYRGPGGLSLTLGVSVPSEAYTQPLMAGLNRRAAFALLLLVIGLLASVQFVRWVSRPLVSLADATRSAAEGEWNRALPRSRIKELDELSKAFGHMRDDLRKTLEGLEETVDARTAELAMANTRLAQLSHTDPLTGLANRRAFDQALAEYWYQARGSKQPLCVIMVDVDWFKDYNDQYGHPAGDRCLKAVASELKQSAKSHRGLAARYGGEEFIILLPDCNKQAGKQIAERLRERVKNLELSHENSPFDAHVTVSAGLSAQEPRPKDAGAQHLVDEADAALYAAKAQGRNRVVIFDPSLAMPNED